MYHVSLESIFLKISGQPFVNTTLAENWLVFSLDNRFDKMFVHSSKLDYETTEHFLDSF
jgi:hypothetical protein